MVMQAKHILVALVTLALIMVEAYGLSSEQGALLFEIFKPVFLLLITLIVVLIL